MFQYLLLSAFVIISVGNAIGEDIYKVVESDSGPVRGKLSTTLYDQKPYFAFRGIPYAEAPVNKLRFKPPVEKRTWTDIFDAFEFGNVCYQNVFLLGEQTTIGSEDCLFLNIYTPDISTETKLPVMFWIHGGGYVEGSGNDDIFGPDFLINEDVILVTINYRLGVFGFMSLGTSEYSGNMGLKDQNMALKWIKKNIEHFGGDSNKITIFGYSDGDYIMENVLTKIVLNSIFEFTLNIKVFSSQDSYENHKKGEKKGFTVEQMDNVFGIILRGASSTHFHVLSPESNTLFQRAILMSGSAINPWSYYSPGDQMLHLFMFIKSTGTNLYNDKDLIKFMQNADSKFLMENIDTRITMAGDARKELELLWGPVIERKYAKKPFIQLKPEDILDNELNNKIDTMFGFTSAEFLFLIAEEAHDPKLLEPFDETFEIQLTKNSMDTKYASEKYKELAQEIRNFYFGEDGRVSNETLTEYNDLLSDVFMVYGIDQSAKAHAKKSQGKTYYYRFSVEAKLNFFKILFNTESMSGTSHGDEVCYLFRCNIIDDVYHNIDDDSIEMKTIRAVTKLWTNFAKFGNPTPKNDPIKFEPIEKDLINFIDITNDGLVPALGPHNKFMNFWTDIFAKHDIIVKDLKAKDEL